MALYTLAPPGKQTYLDANGAPLSGGKVFVYLAGTTTKATTYSDTAGTENANPVVCDTAGRCTIFLAPGTYKIVVTTSLDTDPPTSPLWTLDNVTALASYDGGVIVRNPTLHASVVDGNMVWLEDGRGGGTAGTWYQTNASYDNFSPRALFVGRYDEASNCIRIWGEYTTSGLTPGAQYYLSTSAGGAISSTPGNVVRPVGVALSATKLLLQAPQNRNAWYGRSGTSIAANVGGADTALGRFVIYADEIRKEGEGFIVTGSVNLAGNTNSKTLKLKVGDGTATAFMVNAANVSNHVVSFRLEVRYRSATSGRMLGLSYVGAATAGAPTNYMVNVDLGTLDWTADQTVEVQGNSSTSSDIVLTDIWAYPILPMIGQILA